MLYTRENLRYLKRENDLKVYNDMINNFVKYISEDVVKSATIGKLQYDYPCEKIDNAYKNYVIAIGEDISYIEDIIDKLKKIFIDSDIQYLESKDLRGKVLERVIRIKWD